MTQRLTQSAQGFLVVCHFDEGEISSLFWVVGWKLQSCKVSKLAWTHSMFMVYGLFLVINYQLFPILSCWQRKHLITI